MRHTIALGVVLFLCGFGTDVFAKRYYPKIDARPILVEQISLTKSSGVYAFQTDDLQPSSKPCSGAPDTQIVVRAPNGKIYQNDNVPPTIPESKRSRVSFSSDTGLFTIYVFAVSDTTCGRTDLYVTEPGGDRMRIRSNAEFGGPPIQLSGLQAGKEYLFQTAHDPKGPPWSQILIVGADWTLKAEAHANGISDPRELGRAAQLRAVYATGDRALVGAFRIGSGSAALIIDDCFYTPDTDDEALRNACKTAGRDADGDNLSDALESEVGTDPKHWDTDHDGINDYFELIGRATPTGNVSLRKMGADPLHRDLFLEVDSRYKSAPNTDCDKTNNPFEQPLAEEDIQKVRDTLRALPRLPRNPDLTTGIYLHVDRGAACNDETLCGDWGGSENWGCVASDSQAAQYFPKDAVTCERFLCDQRVFRKERWEIFRYALRWNEGTGQTDSSSAYSNWPFLYFNGDDSNRVHYLAHELGHTMGLQHYGRPGLSGMNRKVNYPSIMSYAFQNKDAAGFSRGELSPINHLSMSELTWSAGRDKSYLKEFGFNICGSPADCPGAANPSDAVDWNMDGRFTSGGVRFDISPSGEIGGPGQTWPHGHDHETFKLFSAEYLGGFLTQVPRPAAGGPALVYVQKSADVYTPYAFYVTTAGELRYSNLTSNSPFGTSWTKLQVSFDLAASGSTAAAVYPGFSSILIVHPEDRTGKLGWAIFSTISNSVTASGVVPGWPVGVKATNATLAASTLVPAVMMAFRNTSSDGVWVATYTFAGWGPLSRAVDETGKNLTSLGTPGLVQASDGRVYLLRLQTNDTAYMELFSGNGETFSKIPGTGIADAIADPDRTLWSRINLLYLPFLTGAGDEFADRSGYLAAFYEQGAKPRWARAYLRGYVAPGGAQFTGTDSSPRNQYVVPNQKWGISIAAARHGPHAGVLYVSEDGDDRMEYVPYANGIPPVAYGSHVDTNDADVIDQGLCSVLKFRSCSKACSCRSSPAQACASATLLDKKSCPDE